MPQSLSLVIVHFVFSTEERFPFLQGDCRSSIFAYLASLCHDLDCQKCKVGGTADQVSRIDNAASYAFAGRDGPSS